MTTLESYCEGHVFVINLARRADRWQQLEMEMERLGIERYTRFEAYEMEVDGKRNGNAGCTASHRALLEIIAWNKFTRACVFEDDVKLSPNVQVGNWASSFSAMVREVPADMDLLYLGGHYADKPIARVGPCLIRAGRMHTTSSYIITQEAARRMAPHISGVGPIDVLFSNFAERQKHYIFQPRLFIQREGYSDIQEQTTKNEWAMQDSRHESMV